MEPLRGAARRRSQFLLGTLEHPGDKHLVSEAHLARSTAAVVRTLGDLELIVRLHWPKGERRWSDGPGGWHWPRPVNCTIQAGQTRANGAPPPRSIQATRLECARGADAAEFWKRCRTRLAVIGEDEAATERNWGVMGANNLMQHALGEVDGWPTLFGGGCCAYPASDHSVVPVPVELRRRTRAPGAIGCSLRVSLPWEQRESCGLGHAASSQRLAGRCECEAASHNRWQRGGAVQPQIHRVAQSTVSARSTDSATVHGLAGRAEMDTHCGTLLHRGQPVALWALLWAARASGADGVRWRLCRGD